MKRFLLIIVVLFIGIQFIKIDKTNLEVDKTLEITTPQPVKDIFVKACYDCHSQQTVWPWYSNIAPFSWSIAAHVRDGRKSLDFSTWQNYTPEIKQEKLKEIYRTVYAAMPLSSYKYFHDKANLSKEEITLIRDWTGVRK